MKKATDKITCVRLLLFQSHLFEVALGLLRITKPCITERQPI